MVKKKVENRTIEENNVDIFCSEATNSLISLNKKKIKYNAFQRKAEIVEGGLKVNFKEFETKKEKLSENIFKEFELGKPVVRTNTWKLLDIIMMEFTKNNSLRSKKVDIKTSIPLLEIAKLLGYDVEPREVPAEEEAKEKTRIKGILDNVRKEVDKDSELLYMMSLSWQSPSKRRDFLDMRLLQGKGIKRNTLTIWLSTLFGEYLVGSYINKYPVNILKTKGVNPVSYQLGLRLSNHYCVNKIKKNNNLNRLGLKSILESVGDIPKIEEVKELRHWTRYIQEPILRALEHLKEVEVLKDYQFQNKKGNTLTLEEISKLEYLEFEKLYLYFEMCQ